jgi:glycosyltransferase involved in cell wall biosynthesis
MRILQINDVDLPGRRFNGYDLNMGLRSRGHEAMQCVFGKSSEGDQVRSIPEGTIPRRIWIAAERKFSVYGKFIPYGRTLMKMPEFRQADLVHYHLIHNHILSLRDFPRLSKAKPTVWTWHDPWAVTGHCVHPKDCRGWETGCTTCPHLDEYFPLRRDTAGQLFEMKRKAYSCSDIDIVVSSDFMMDFAKNSPLGQCFSRIHKIPFGIQLEQYAQTERAVAREMFHIPQENFVIAFRCEDNPYKGMHYIESMFEKWSDTTHVTLLSVGFKKLPKALKERFHTVDLGWCSDDAVMAQFYAACDVFLMPSIAESFGLMSVEAMASSRPVICFTGTALPSVTFAPDCGIAVPKGDADELLAAVERLRQNPQEARTRGELGRKLAEEHYGFDDYVARHLALYQEILERKQGRYSAQNTAE